jgi:hypothetical protein
MKIVNITVAFLLIATPATAWNVTTNKDRMSDKTLTWAGASSGNAILVVGCLNGHVQPRLTWPARIGWGDLGISYRFDDGPVVPRMAMVSQDGSTLYPWIGDYADAMSRLAKAKRLRVTIGSGKDGFYDFDLLAGGAWPNFGKC